MSVVRELVWRKDGHYLTLTLSKTSLLVSVLACPHGEKEGSECYHQGVRGCIVKHFVNTYGLDTHIGQVSAEPTLEIAWSSEGSEWDIDLVTFFMIPVEDPTFQEWLQSQLSSE